MERLARRDFRPTWQPPTTAESPKLSDEERERFVEERRRRLAADDERQRVQRLEQAVDTLAKQLGPRYGPNVVTLDNFVVKHKGQQQILNRVKAIAARLPDAVARGESIIWYGTVGVGKDHMMASLLYTAIRQHGMYPRWESGLTCCRPTNLMARYGLDSAAILAISDPIPPEDEILPSVLNALFQLVDQRYRKALPMWLTVNAQSEQEIEAKLSAQVFDRLRQGAHMLPCFWPSYRQEAVS